MRQPVMAFGDADFRIGAEVQLASEHERRDARDVGAVGQPLQLVHQLHVLVEPLRHALGTIQRRQLGLGTVLDGLDSPFDLADRIDVFRQLGAVGRSEPPLQTGEVLEHRIENALVLARLGGAPRRGAAVAEQPLEHDARIVLGRQRRRRRGPRQRVQVGAAVAVLALPGQEIEIDGELERRQRRLLAEHRRGNLIGGDAVADVGAFGALGVHAGEPRARAARVIAARPVVAGFRLIVIEPADDHHPVAKRRQRRQDLRQLESRSLAARRPVVDAGGVHRDAVRHVDEAETTGRTGRRVGQRRQRRHHRVEQRQRQRRPHAAEERPARQRHFGDEHLSVLLKPSSFRRSASAVLDRVIRLHGSVATRLQPAILIRNGALCTTPRISDDIRYSVPADSRTIARIAGAS